MTAGGSATEFTLKLPSPAATPAGPATCTGDSPNASYRVQSSIVPASVDPATLTFASQGPTAVAGQFRAPLYDTTGSPYVNKQTSVATPPATEGPIVQPLPSFNYAIYSPGEIPAGTYNVGIACTLGPAGPTQLDKYWNVVKTFRAVPADSPAQIGWTVAASDPTTTTTSTTAAVTTSTTRSSTTTSTSSSTSTSTTVSGSVSGSGSGTSTGATAAAAGAATELPRSGGTFLPLVTWAFFLICFGRAAVLLGRRPAAIVDRR